MASATWLTRLPSWADLARAAGQAVRVAGRHVTMNSASAKPPARPAPPGFPPPPAGPGFAAQFPYPPPLAATSWPAGVGAVLPESAVAVGDLPRICVVTGQPTDDMKHMRWVWAPSWIALFIVVSGPLVFVLRHMLGDKASGYLPVHRSVTRKFAAYTAGGYLLVFVGVLQLCIAAGVLSGQLALLGVVVSTAGFLLAEVPHRLLPVRRGAQGYLSLPKASPEFAAAFRGGRPAGQVPYASQHRHDNGRRRMMWIVVGTPVVVAVVVAVLVPTLAGQS